jgi:membrane associated rhomboid family serine protease
MRAGNGEAALLIIPLHKRPTAATFPWVTLLLILANVFVFAFLQSGDAGVERRALAYWQSSGLAEVELPRYVAQLQQRGEMELAEFLESGEEPMRTELGFRAVQHDAAFAARVAARDVLPEDDPEHARWRERRDALDAIWDSSFTQRFVLKYDDVSVKRLFGAMFLHGDGGHLVGNMVFLALLGLLVEGALGPWVFLGMYLVGGLGGSLLSVVRHLGEAGGALGASGAIAALMGAYCVVWGLRKVRFFYWFFVVFDYVKAPALVLLPAWLGWELLNMTLNSDAGIGFDAHAGGIMTGALLAFGVRRLGWERRGFLDEELQRDARAELRERAFGHYGRLELARARPLLAELALEAPGDLEVALALYRCWRSEPARAEFHAAARAVLMHPSGAAADRARVRDVFADYVVATAGRPRLADPDALALARRFMMQDSAAEAERLLEIIGERDPVPPGVAEAWLALALRAHERRDAVATKRLLARVAERYPGSATARKAAFLLENA